MQYNDEFYENCVHAFVVNIKNMFYGDMKQVIRLCAFMDHGSFRLSYEYIPLKYTITIESEMRTFDIRIEDEEKASTHLWRIEKHENTLNEKNIYDAICLLKKALNMDDIDLYIYTDKKVYVKNKQEVKRVKNWRALVDEWI